MAIGIDGDYEVMGIELSEAWRTSRQDGGCHTFPSGKYIAHVYDTRPFLTVFLKEDGKLVSRYLLLGRDEFRVIGPLEQLAAAAE